MQSIRLNFNTLNGFNARTNRQIYLLVCFLYEFLFSNVCVMTSECLLYTNAKRLHTKLWNTPSLVLDHLQSVGLGIEQIL